MNVEIGLAWGRCAPNSFVPFLLAKWCGPSRKRMFNPRDLEIQLWGHRRRRPDHPEDFGGFLQTKPCNGPSLSLREAMQRNGFPGRLRKARKNLTISKAGLSILISHHGNAMRERYRQTDTLDVEPIRAAA